MLRFRTMGMAVFLVFFQCDPSADQKLMTNQTPEIQMAQAVSDSLPGRGSRCILGYVPIPHTVDIAHYFSFIDSIKTGVDTFQNVKIDEYVLVHANPWIIDSLRSSDYYIQKRRGIFLFDQSKWIVLRKGDSLAIPDSSWTASILEKLKSTTIDLNIPEFILRVVQSGDTILTTKVRVGRNEIQYLALAGHDVDLRTPIGRGKIIRIERNPIVINPETAERYKGTHRDDALYTKMPIIPWLEPEINGIRYGALIHPTTNPVTLGFPYSHGCVGTSEADAWIIYYNSPLGTKVNFRYDLQVVRANGDTLNLPDVYNLRKKR
jgi:lipoprotein-anchoring transpeptidase ErfK/SrfK